MTSQVAKRLATDGARSRALGSLATSLEKGVMALTLMTVAVGGSYVMLLALDVVQPGELLGGLVQRTALPGWFGGVGPRFDVAAVSAAVSLLALGGLVWQLRVGQRRGNDYHLITADERGFVLVDARTIETTVEYAALRTPGVVDVNASVQARGPRHPVNLTLDVYTHPGARLREAGERARQEALEAVEELIGMGVHRVTVDMHVLEADQLAELLR